MFHDAPVFRINNHEILAEFCHRYHIHANTSLKKRIADIAKTFSVVPYENLTKIIKADEVISAKSAMRYPDEVLSDHLRWGTGGTCFSLTAAIIAVYDAFGIEAHPILADRHYGVDTHCGLVVLDGHTMLLLDPGYLLFTPVALPATVSSVIEQGYTSIELRPYDEGAHIELATSVQGNRKVRLVYKRNIVDAATFHRAWVASFSWEMMTYPVATRHSAGSHFYVQGLTRSVRGSNKTVRSKMDIAENIRTMKTDMGIAEEITTKAWSVLHGVT